MQLNVPSWRSGLGRATICLAYVAIAAAFMLSSAGCGANGKLFGPKQPPPPATIKEFLLLPRPE